MDMIQWEVVVLVEIQVNKNSINVNTATESIIFLSIVEKLGKPAWTQMLNNDPSSSTSSFDTAFAATSASSSHML